MNGTFNQAWDYMAEERMAEYARRAARQQLLDQAPIAPRTSVVVVFAHLVAKLAARFIQRQNETSPAPDTSRTVTGEHIHIATR